MNGSLQETIKRIDERLDEAVIQRLVLHAATKMERHYWQGILDGSAPGGKEAMDFVEQAIEKTVKGLRKWDYAAQPDLYLHLLSVIDSDINHLAESWQNRRFRSEAALAKTTEDGETIDALAKFPSEASSPSDICIEAEQERAREKVLFEFFEFLSDDPKIQKVLELLFDGVNKSEIPIRLSISKKEMYVLNRRLERRVTEFKRKKSKIISEAQTNV